MTFLKKIFFLIIFFFSFLLSSSVFAETVGKTNGNEYTIPDFPTTDFNENVAFLTILNDNYYLFTYVGESSSVYVTWEGGNKWINYNGNGGYNYVYSCSLNGTSWSQVYSRSGYHSSPDYGWYQPDRVVWTSIDITYSSGETFDADDYYFGALIQNPVIINTLTAESQAALVNNSFTNFVVSSYDYEYNDDIDNYPIVFYINNGSTGLESEKLKYIVLTTNSPYYDHYTVEVGHCWVIPKIDTIPIYNRSMYNIWLRYTGISSDNVYSYTTSFSSTTANWQQDLLTQGAETNAFLGNSEVDDNDFELPEVSVNDITGSFFTTLIGGFVNVFATVSPNETLIIDYRGKTYTINSSDFNFLGSAGFSALKTLISLAWVFGLGYWVLCDLRFRIQRLQTFGWTSMFADDIVEKIL